MEKLRANIVRRRLTFSHFFRMCDSNGRGELTRRQLQQGLEQIGIVLDYSEATHSKRRAAPSSDVGLTPIIGRRHFPLTGHERLEHRGLQGTLIFVEQQ